MKNSDAISEYLKQTKDLYGDHLFLSLTGESSHVDYSDESLDQFFEKISNSHCYCQDEIITQCLYMSNDLKFSEIQ